jgi:SnoaL-like domain
VSLDPQQETIDYIAITRLQSAYGDTVNRRAWDEFGTLFLPDAPVHIDTVTNPTVDVIGPAELGRFIGGAVERFEFFEFVILNAVVDIGGTDDTDADRARGRLFMCELRQERDSGRWTNAFGVYRDDYARVDGRWWFARRRYQSLARTGRADVFPFPKDS